MDTPNPPLLRPVIYGVPMEATYINETSPEFQAGLRRGNETAEAAAATERAIGLARQQDNIEEMLRVMAEMPPESASYLRQVSEYIFEHAAAVDLNPRALVASLSALIATVAMAEVNNPQDEEGFMDFQGFAADALAVAIVQLRVQGGWSDGNT